MAKKKKEEAGLCPPDSLPRLLSSTEYAILTGIPHATVKSMVIRGRLVGAQKVSGRWVIPENADILDIGTEEDPEIAALAKHFSTKPTLDWTKELPITERKFRYDEGTEHPKIRVPGFKRVKEKYGFGMREIRRRTKVHNTTQAKMLKGEKVHPSIVVRLAKGLEVDVEELLK